MLFRNEMSPLVTIITVTYNSEKTVRKTIESVLNQTYSNIEYIIVDGASNDGTLDIVSEYKEKFQEKKLTVISEKDHGIYDAMNKGINLAEGELIGIINSDDWLEEKGIEDIISTWNLKKIDGVYHGFQRLISAEGDELMITQTNSNNLRNKMIEHSACFVSKNIYKKYGNFNLDYKYCSDYDLMLSLKEARVEFVKVNAIISNFTLGGVSSTSKATIESLTMRYNRRLITYKHYILKKYQHYFLSILKKILTYY